MIDMTQEDTQGYAPDRKVNALVIPEYRNRKAMSLQYCPQIWKTWNTESSHNIQWEKGYIYLDNLVLTQSYRKWSNYT